ncbi:unnamed protein product [Linum trigynum]|uniref:Uncharacterized protein n=1 Tax=Linum trigynum TaxID=586398 RepID=A0AAV2D0Y2_9ROSI
MRRSEVAVMNHEFVDKSYKRLILHYPSTPSSPFLYEIKDGVQRFLMLLSYKFQTSRVYIASVPGICVNLKGGKAQALVTIP